ncbi:uncharacterized protein LOC112554712 [Pomacea canaliculata]|uniref:uncharacterized protein LOC112554712 n=1 Tax=Pomacea canaliculata TaxID=400727 RepID=UPI000D72E031|nr:uncharacterized protein LOC112554712 [Pomacea canaliculata]
MMRVLFVAVSLLLQSCQVETDGRFFLGFLEYLNSDNRNFSGECCDGAEDSSGMCQDPCDLLFQASVTGLNGLNTITRRLSDRPFNSSSHPNTTFQFLSQGLTNPLVFTFDEWPMCVQVTIEIDDVDMIYTDGRPNKMELVDTMSLLVTSQAPSAMYMYTPETLIGSRRGHPFRLKVAYRFDWDEHADDIILEDSAHITKTNTLLCPGATTSLATSSSSISIIDSSLRPATSSSVARSSTLSLPPSSPTDIKIQPTTTLHQTAELSTSSILETSFVLQMIISESSVMTERSAVTSGWTELIVETDFTSETSTKATQNSASDSPIHPTQSLKVDSSTEPSHFSMSSILFTEMSPTPTRDMSSNILAATSTSTEFKETSSFPSYTEVPDENGNKSSPVVMTESPDEPMKYWELILGCVLGGMALISLLGFLFYLRKQRAMLKRQEIYTVTPRLVSVVEENGTAGRSDIPVETAEY